MSDIRLKSITVEPLQTLVIKKGNLSITNTTISVNRLSGSIVINGGIGINCTYDSISSTSGGALSIGGGLSVSKKTFFGDNVIFDSNNSTLSANGISTYRLFLDTVSNKNFYISPNGIDKRFDLFDTTLNINITTNSINASTGSLIINGGISINNTVDSINSSNGGALTVSGGLAIGGNSYLSKTLTIGQLYSNQFGLSVRYTGNSQIMLQNSSGSKSSSLNMYQNDLIISNADNFLFNTSSGNFSFSNNTFNTLLTIGQNTSTFYKYTSINDTVESLNSTTGSLIIKGGASIQCTTESVSFTNGGSLTINGGLGVSKKIFTGSNIGIELSNNTKNNKIVLYQVSNDLQQNNLFTGLGVTSGSMRFQLPNTSNDYLFYSSNTAGTNSTEVFRIKGTNEVQFIGNTQRYSILGGSSSDLSIQGQSIATPSSVGFYTADGDSGDINDIKIYGLGIPSNIVNSEYLKIGWNMSDYIISTNKSGTGNNNNIIIQTNSNSEQFKLSSNGTISISSTTQSDNSTIGAFVLLSGGLSINATNDTTSLTSGGALTVNGGMSVIKSMYIGNKLHIFSTNGNISLSSQNSNGDLIISNPTNIFNFAGNNTTANLTSNLSLFNLNNKTIGNYQVFSIKSESNVININSKSGGTGILHSININTGLNTGLFVSTNGNIGINTTNPGVQLDINGTIKANDYSLINQLTIYNTSDSINTSTSGSLTVLGGASISKKLFVGGQTTFTNTSESSNTSASVYLLGGLTVASGQSGAYGSGALTVNGGGYFGGELYVQQNLNVIGQINGGSSSSSSFAYLSLTATDEALNLSTGSLVTFGGITIQTYKNSQNVSNGGSLLTPGGASIGKDLYVGGNLYNYGISHYYDNNNTLINFYDLSNIRRFSIDRNVSNNALSISRYDGSGTVLEKSLDISNSNGIITLNNTTTSTSISSAALVLRGGITISCTEISPSIGNGGGLSVFGGASISKNLNIGGDVYMLSSTVSTTYSEGALKVVGGVGISGNLNVLGNTIINGNLSVLGNTNTIYSTNTLLSDNVLVINSGPAGTSDAGILIQRYQINNDTGSGDVVNTAKFTNFTLTSQSSATNVQIKLDAPASNVNNYYNGWWIKITSGYSSNQVRKIIAYNGTTYIATIDNAWTTQNPSINDTVKLYSTPYVGLFWNETFDKFDLGSTINDPGVGNVVLTGYSSLKLSSLDVNDNIDSINISTGSIIVAGGISINTTTDATSHLSGNGLTIAGGAGIAKSLYVGTNMYIAGVNITPNPYDTPSSVTFNALDNVTNSTFITINSNVWGFDMYVSIRLSATTSLYSNYIIRGVNKQTSWEIVSNYTGDNIVSFNITNTGILQYTTPNHNGFTSLVFKYKIITN